MEYHVNGKTIPADEEGYITNLADWDKDVALEIAKSEGIEMDDERWEVVNFLRDYYDEYQIAPAVRVLIKAIKKSMGPEKGNNKYLYELFPYGPAKQACKNRRSAETDRLRLIRAASGPGRGPIA
ncbi:TusE/DsrC/DsvC family sulfur relay protein [Jhaorihella thermophila]